MSRFFRKEAAFLVPAGIRCLLGSGYTPGYESVLALCNPIPRIFFCKIFSTYPNFQASILSIKYTLIPYILTDFNNKVLNQRSKLLQVIQRCPLMCSNLPLFLPLNITQPLNFRKINNYYTLLSVSPIKSTINQLLIIKKVLKQVNTHMRGQ